MKDLSSKLSDLSLKVDMVDLFQKRHNRSLGVKVVMMDLSGLKVKGDNDGSLSSKVLVEVMIDLSIQKCFCDDRSLGEVVSTDL